MNDAAIKRRKRGEANEDDLARFSSFSEADLLSLLRSEKPVERTCAAIHLQKFQNSFVVSGLCKQLSDEKKLYSKLAVCETLAKCSELSIKPLIELSVTKIEQRYQFSWMVPCAVIHARYLWNVQNDLNLRKIQPNVSGNIP
ncbi:MAG: hypothetical protein ACT6FD_06690 [Methanosarcinaceae archaeon]